MKKILLVIISLYSFSFSQGFDGVGLSMAGTYSALSRGVYAQAYNPANLALERSNSVELNILSLNLGLFNNSFSIDDYNRYFTVEGHGDWWTEKDKQNILDLLPESGLGLNSEVVLNGLGLAIHNFALTVQTVSYGGFSFINNKQILEIALFGDNISRNYEYRDDNLASGAGFGAVKISAGYGYLFEDLGFFPFLDEHIDYLAVGANFNYYLGIGTIQVKDAAILVRREQLEDTETTKYRVRADIISSIADDEFPAGRGVGLDFGLAAGFGAKWNFSLAFKNMFARIQWTGKPEHSVLLIADSAETKDIAGDREDFVQEEDSVYSIDGFSTDLPKSMQAAIAYKLLNNLTLTAEWEQGFNSTYGNTTKARVGAGVEYFPLTWLPLRSGISFGGKYGFFFGLGTGLQFEHFEFDLSYGMSNGMWPSESEGAFVAFGFKTMF